MTKRRYHQYRWIRRLTILLAAAPLFQLSQCATGMRQVSANVANSLPATIFSIMEGFLLLPLQLLLAGGSTI